MVSCLLFCLQCGKDIPERKLKYNPKFCSRKCSNDSMRKGLLPIIKAFSDNLSTGTKGAISELIISSDLLQRGLEVFRALSPAASCDLVIRYKDSFYGIEVRTATVQPSGRICWHNQDIRAPILAIVFGVEKTIIYQTEIHELFHLLNQYGPERQPGN